VLRPQAAAVAAFALAVCSSCLFGGPAPVIKIGVDLPLSGAEARAAMPALNGIRYYGAYDLAALKEAVHTAKARAVIGARSPAR